MLADGNGAFRSLAHYQPILLSFFWGVKKKMNTDELAWQCVCVRARVGQLTESLSLSLSSHARALSLSYLCIYCTTAKQSVS
jgi:hypothetical protein